MISWPEAGQKIEGGITLHVGGDRAISKGFSESSLTACLSEEFRHMYVLSKFQFGTGLFDRLFRIRGFTAWRQCRISLSLLSDEVVYFTALQQIIFNAGRAILEKMGRDSGRSTHTSSSSQDLTSILQWMGEHAIDGLCFHPPWVQCCVCFVPRSSRMIFAECESSKTPLLSQLIQAERSPNGS